MINVENDISLYATIIQSLFSGKIPFIHYYFEYPPLIVLALILPGIWFFLTNFNQLQFVLAFYIQNYLLVFITAYLVKRYRGEKVKGVDIITTVLLFIMGVVSLGRADLFICTLVILGFLLLKNKKNVFLGLLLIVLAGFMKLYAFVFLPIILIYYLKDKDIKSAIKLIGIFMGLLIGHIAIYLVNPKGFEFLINYHKVRGFQLESIYSGVIMLLPLKKLKILFSYGSENLVFSGANILLIIPAIIVIVGMAMLYYKFARSKVNTMENTLTFCVLTLIWFILFNKVFSTQFFVWFLPMVRLIKLEEVKQRFMNKLVIFSSITATLVYPFAYVFLLHDRIPLAIFICVKNIAVLALFITILKFNKDNNEKLLLINNS